METITNNGKCIFRHPNIDIKNFKIAEQIINRYINEFELLEFQYKTFEARFLFTKQRGISILKAWSIQDEINKSIQEK